MGQNIYLLTAPLFKEILLKRENGKEIRIIAESLSESNIYIKSVELNGKQLNRAWITHDEIKDGAVIKFIMDSKPSDWGQEILPPTLDE